MMTSYTHKACKHMFVSLSHIHCCHVTKQKCNVSVNKCVYNSLIEIHIKMHGTIYNCFMQTDEQRHGDYRSTPISSQIDMDQFSGGPDDDSKESKHVAL
jgi:hypothetical protein